MGELSLLHVEKNPSLQRKCLTLQQENKQSPKIVKSKLIPKIAPGTLDSSSLLLKPYQQHHNDSF